MRKTIFLFSLLLIGAISRAATNNHAVQSPQFQDNWYVQLGVDLSLQMPYDYPTKDCFKHGRTWGVDAAIGRWFTPELGVRAKLNWENGIPLFENKNATWLAPFDQPGVNMDKGGYLSAVWDAQLDVHNILFGYDEERMWNLQVYPRAGLVYNFGVSKGSPLLGVGIGNSFRVNNRLSIICDVCLQGVSSGFTGVVKSTGVNANANMYVDANIGIQINLGKMGFKKTK